MANKKDIMKSTAKAEDRRFFDNRKCKLTLNGDGMGMKALTYLFTASLSWGSMGRSRVSPLEVGITGGGGDISCDPH